MENEDHPQRAKGADQSVDDTTMKGTLPRVSELGQNHSMSNSAQLEREREEECNLSFRTPVLSARSADEIPGEGRKEKSPQGSSPSSSSRKRSRSEDSNKEDEPKPDTQLRKIYDTIKKHGRPMTNQEIADATGLGFEAVRKCTSTNSKTQQSHFVRRPEDPPTFALTPKTDEPRKTEESEEEDHQPSSSKRQKRSSAQPALTAFEMVKSVLADSQKPLSRSQLWAAVQEKFGRVFQQETIFVAINRDLRLENNKSIEKFKKTFRNRKTGKTMKVVFYGLVSKSRKRSSEREKEKPEAESSPEGEINTDEVEAESAEPSDEDDPDYGKRSRRRSKDNRRSSVEKSQEAKSAESDPEIDFGSQEKEKPEAAAKALPSHPSSFGISHPFAPSHQPPPQPSSVNEFLKPVQISPPLPAAPLFPSAGKSSGAAPSLSRPKSPPALCDPTKFADANNISLKDLQLLVDHGIVEQKMIGVGSSRMPRISESAIGVIRGLPSFQELSRQLNQPELEVCHMVTQNLLWHVTVSGCLKFFKVKGSFLRGHIPVELTAQKLGFTVQEFESQWALWRLQLFEFCGNKYVNEEQFKKIAP